ncbi:secreted protein-like protein [Leptotrombidium deliense]|uniref:Secreted protein-like protein n=1 Tax=Leptotrombidium deliense TaxID=299467 RepID=A0A443RW90_9ACAR|nr:secreted protein-like protein [Leptotrombidium deliense]
MIEDFETFEEIKKQFPYNIFRVKYEPLALDTENYSRKLFKALNIPFSDEVKTFIKTHTSLENNTKLTPYSTTNNSKKIPSKWMQELTISNISEIQNSCKNYKRIDLPENIY